MAVTLDSPSNYLTTRLRQAVGTTTPGLYYLRAHAVVTRTGGARSGASPAGRGGVCGGDTRMPTTSANMASSGPVVRSLRDRKANPVTE